MDSRADPEAFGDMSAGGQTGGRETSSLLALLSSAQSGKDTGGRAGSVSSTGGSGSTGKGDTAAGVSASGLSASSSAGGAARLLTISERNESSPSRSMEVPFFTIGSTSSPKKDTFKYPVLPPLSEAQSVKQKWNILLSKVIP